MRIGLIAPLSEPVCPHSPGRVEQIVSHLTEELVRQGHEVTLFASGDSITSARLHSVFPVGLRAAGVKIPGALTLLSVERAYAAVDEFDLIHSHAGPWSFPVMWRTDVPALATIYVPVEAPIVHAMFDRYRGLPLVSVYPAQQAIMPGHNWLASIPYGFPAEMYRFQANPGKYLSYVGPLFPGVHLARAVRVATNLGVPLKIWGKCEPANQNAVDRLLEHSLVEVVDVATCSERIALLASSLALVVPGEGSEPGGIDSIEAMALGTPCIALRRGPDGSSLWPVIEEGITGFYCSTDEDLTRAIRRTDRLDRLGCRAAFEARFTAEQMARSYVNAYERLLARLPFSKSSMPTQ